MPKVQGLSNAATSAIGKITSGQIGNVVNILKGAVGVAALFNIGNLGNQLGLFNNGGLDNYPNYLYRYRVTKFELTIPGRSEPINILPIAVEKIIITKNYDNAIHPIIEVVTTLPPKIHQAMKDYKSEAKINLRVMKDQYTKGGDLRRSTYYINNSFSLIMDDDTDFKEKSQYEAVNKANGGDGKEDKFIFNISDYTMEYIITLWNIDHINAMRSEVNGVFKNTTVSNIIKTLYTKAGFKKILISPLDNNDKYDEIIIKPMNLLNLNAYLDKIYGTYYTGSLVFCDVNCLYFINKSGMCTAKQSGEYTRTIFNVPKSDKADTKRVGTIKNTRDKIYYFYLNSENIEFGAPSNSNDAINGNNFTIIDTKNSDTVEANGVGTQTGSGNNQIIEDNYSNIYNKSTRMNDVVESSRIAIVKLWDYDDDAMTPNKEFVISMEEDSTSDKNGFYRLVESQIVLNKESADMQITGTHKLVFKQSTNKGTNEENNATVVTDTKNKIDEKISENKPCKGPQAKVTQLDKATISTTKRYKDAEIKRDPNQQYDLLGNLKGIKIPSYNMILKTDDNVVRRLKTQAQQKLLPCKGPKPKKRRN